MVGIFEDNDAAKGLVFVLAVDIEHIADHFTDPKASCGIVIEGDGLLDHGLGGEGFHGEVVRDFK